MAHDFIKQEYEKTSIATPSAITMSASKIFFGLKLIRLSDGSQSKLQGGEFYLLLEELSLLSSPNI
jgi:hypothetical protein